MNTLDQQARWLAAERRPDETLLRRYRAVRTRADLGAAIARIFGRDTALGSLEALLGGRQTRGARAAGLRSVPIASIVASEGRVADFDRAFRPLQDHTWERWRSVAAAMLRGDSLPPVELLAAGGRYAVRDGHHRISAAAAFGIGEVDAIVTVLEL